MRFARWATAVAILGLVTSIQAQQQQQPPPGGRGGGRGGRGAMQRPERDARREVPAGTAVIAGRVLTADTGRPIKRARVVVTGGGRPFSASTDDAGRFTVAGLPAATYNVVATKSGFVDATFGQRRPQRAGTPIELKDGQQVSNVDIRLHRGGVITGRIVDEDGEPLAQAIVTVLRQQYVRGERQLVPAGVNQSDDRGIFRVFGLPPGEYSVSATAGGLERLVRQFAAGMGAGQEPNESTGYAATYYPGVIASSDAARLKLAAAQELGGIDFQIQVVPLATVKGMVSGGAATVMLLPDGLPMGGGGGGRGGRGGLADVLGAVGGALRGAQALRAATAADGTFTIRNVTPGKYTIVARSDVQGSSATAVQPLTVAGDEVMVALSPVPPATMTGTITLESSGAQPPKGFGGFRIAATPAGAIAALPRGARPADANERGEFTIADAIPGHYTIRGNAPRGWTLKAVYLDGRDVTDQTVEVKSGNLTGLNVIFSDRVSSVSGTVRDERGEPAGNRTVIAFSVDEKLWYPQSRHIVTGRTDGTGTYRLNALPEGTYLIVAVEDVEQGEWFDPEFLAEIKSGAERITVSEGEQKQQDLKAAR